MLKCSKNKIFFNNHFFQPFSLARHFSSSIFFSLLIVARLFSFVLHSFVLCMLKFFFFIFISYFSLFSLLFLRNTIFYLVLVISFFHWRSAHTHKYIRRRSTMRERVQKVEWMSWPCGDNEQWNGPTRSSVSKEYAMCGLCIASTQFNCI